MKLAKEDKQYLKDHTDLIFTVLTQHYANECSKEFFSSKNESREFKHKSFIEYIKENVHNVAIYILTSKAVIEEELGL